MSESFNPGRHRACTGLRALREAQAGVTLIELMTVIGMLGIVFTGAFFFYTGALNRTEETEARVDTLAELEVAGERITRDVRDSASICAPAPGAGSNYLALSGPPETGSFATASNCEADRMIIYDCSTTPGTCTRSEGGGSPVLAVEGLATGSPVFASSGGNEVAIDLRQVPDERDRAVAFQRGATLRNFCEGGCG